MNFYKTLFAQRTGLGDNWYETMFARATGFKYDTLTNVPIASFVAKAGKVKSLTVGIEPIQSGSGDPSPDNVRPISGWSGVEVTRAGKNLLNIPKWLSTFQEGQEVSYADNVLTVGLTAGNLYTKPYKFSDEDIPISVSFESANIGQSIAPRFELLDKNGNAVGSLRLDETTKFITRTASAIRMNWSSLYGFTVSNIQLELGTTATDYEPYQGSSHSIPFKDSQDNPITVYGGEIDVVSGLLKSYPFYSSYNGETLSGEWICDRAVYSQGTTPPIGSQVVDMSGNGTEYQLVPTEVQTLLGTNNIWADSGEVVEVTFRI